MMLNIDSFRSFVDLEAKHETSKITVSDEIECFITVELSSYCETSKRYIALTPSFFGPADSLMIYVNGRSIAIAKKYYVFDVKAKITFKRSLLPGDFTFCFDLENGYQDKCYLATQIKVCFYTECPSFQH